MPLVAASVAALMLAGCGGGDGGTASLSTASASDTDTTTLKPAATSTTSSVWLTIAKDSAAFTVSGTRTVRYGAGSTWVEKSGGVSG